MNADYSGPVKRYPQYYIPENMNINEHVMEHQSSLKGTASEERFVEATPMDLHRVETDRFSNNEVKETNFVPAPVTDFSRGDTRDMRTVVEEKHVMQTETVMPPVAPVQTIPLSTTQPMRMSYNQYHMNTFRESGSAYFQ